MNMIDPATLTLVGRALDAASLRHAAIAQNIANASVPDTRPVRVSFEAMLGSVQQSLRDGRSVDVSSLPEPAVYTDVSPDARIDLDVEISQLARNGMHYQALLRAFGKHLSLMSMAVSEGRR